jgi:hypothetical protein
MKRTAAITVAIDDSLRPGHVAVLDPKNHETAATGRQES